MNIDEGEHKLSKFIFHHQRTADVIKSVSVVIPNYNGMALLRDNLPPLIRAARALTQPWEVIIVDDGSMDGSVDFIKENYPYIILLKNDVNLGFAETMNRGIYAARHDVVVALNNDVVVGDDFFAATLSRFSDSDVFSITPNITDPRTGLNMAVNRVKPGFCWFDTNTVQINARGRRVGEIPLFFASGGSSFFDRAKLLRLEGFDTIYKPFYVEDLDLSYRAWKAGWKCLLEPSVTVVHNHQSTIFKYHERRRIKYIAGRNKTMFMWLNITGRGLIFRYFLLLLPSLLFDIVSFRKYKFIGTFMALKKVPEIIAGRQKRLLLAKMKDRDVISIVSVD